MSFDIPLRQSAWDVALRWALLGSALFDLAFGSAVLINWKWVLRLMQLPLPEHETYLQLAGLMTIGASLMWLMAGLAPYRYHANINIAALTRFANGVLLSCLIERGLLPVTIYALVATELVLAVLHFVYSRRLAAAAAL
jgi:hypothetical protein